MEDLYIIVGLGNPGSRYDNTRHNVGFDAVDHLANKHSIKISKLKHKALIGEGSIDGKKIILVKPQTFMNLSGESVREIIEWYKVPVSRMIIIYDDIDLELSKVRVRPKGSAGTHNGMRSIIYHVQSDEFPRVRIGISRPPQGWNLADFVLSKFSLEDRKLVDEGVNNAVQAVESVIKSGVDAAMNRYNR